MSVFASVAFRVGTKALGRGLRKTSFLKLVVALICVSAVQPAEAQTASSPFAGSTIPASAGGVSTFSQSVTDMGLSRIPGETMVPVGLWILYPTITVGAVYNDNVFRSPFTKIAAPGVRVSPSLIATIGNGIHQFRFYGRFDAIFYPGVPSGNTYDVQAGGAYTWEIRRDLLFQLRGAGERSIGAFANLNALSNTVTFAPTPVNVAATSQYVNQYRASASLEKAFNHLSAALAASVFRMEIAAPNTPPGQQPLFVTADQQGINAAFLNNTTYTATGRVGYSLTTSSYFYVQAAGNQIKYDNRLRDSMGYSAIVGLGSERIGLFRGEIYGGYGQQFYDDPLLGVAAIPLMGGRIEYLPTPLLTISMAFARSVADFSSISGVNGLNAANRSLSSQAITTTVGSATYSFTERLAGAANAGYQWDNIGLNRRLVAGGRLSYNIARNLDAALEYQYTRAFLVFSNPFVTVAAASELNGAFYTENRVSLGVTYKY